MMWAFLTTQTYYKVAHQIKSVVIKQATEKHQYSLIGYIDAFIKFHLM